MHYWPEHAFRCSTLSVVKSVHAEFNHRSDLTSEKFHPVHNFYVDVIRYALVWMAILKTTQGMN